MADYIHCDVESIDACLEEILGEYARTCSKQMAKGIDKTMSDMTRQTRKTAPTEDGKWTPTFPNHSRGEAFKKHIAWKSSGYGMSHTATWYVKSPEHRLTHLLVHGHEQFVFGRPTGKRSKAMPFLVDARDKAEEDLMPNIIKEIEKG